MEPASAIGAVASAGKYALEKVSDSTENQTLLRLGEDSPSMATAVELRARRSLVRQALLLKLWAPLGKLAGLSSDYFNTDFSADLAAATAHIPEDDLVEPPAYIAVPAVQAMAYSLDEAELKAMYLNLLASASDGRTSAPHPSYVDVIKQLSPPEAKILKSVLGHPSLATATITLAGDEGESRQMEHLLPPDVVNSVDQADLAIFVDNWIRLGLINVEYDRWFIAEDAYDWVETHPQMVYWRDSILPLLHKRGDTRKLDFAKGTITIRAFGKDFLRRVISDSETNESTGLPIS